MKISKTSPLEQMIIDELVQVNITLRQAKSKRESLIKELRKVRARKD